MRVIGERNGLDIRAECLLALAVTTRINDCALRLYERDSWSFFNLKRKASSCHETFMLYKGSIDIASR